MVNCIIMEDETLLESETFFSDKSIFHISVQNIAAGSAANESPEYVRHNPNMKLFCGVSKDKV